MLKFVAFTALALTGVTLAAPEPALSAGGFRGGMGGRTGIPFAFAHRPHAAFIRTPRVGFVVPARKSS